MDSFYGTPRQPPTLPIINPVEHIPLVPEVSLIDNSPFPPPFNYNASVRPPQNIDKSLNKDSFIHLKKHVRFKSHHSEPIVPIFGKENMPQTLKAAPNLNGKTFKQIYMANVPDRHLDLSIFEPPTQGNGSMGINRDVMQCDGYGRNNVVEPFKQSDRCAETYRDFKQLNKRYDSFDNSKSRNVTRTKCNTQSVTTLKSIENTASHSSWRDSDRYLFNRTNLEECLDKRETYRHKKPCTEICIQTEPPPSEKTCTDIATPSDEPTLKDLFLLIKQQNEQIMHLQHQVNNLKTSIRQPEIDSVPHEAHTERTLMKDFNSPSKKNLFSFGVKATSVEFSFRTQQHKFRKNDFLEQKIQEIDESDSTADDQSASLHFDESIEMKNMRNSCVSNAQSIAIEMNAYQGSDDEKADSEEDEIGLTLYNGLMKQVKNALKNAQKNSDCGNNTRQAMGVVKQATLQHLSNIGVNLSPIQESSEVTGSTDIDVENYDESDVSCQVQQLLMKYLPPDKLAKVVSKSKEPLLQLKERKKKPSNTEFSFATIQYMKKYNLIDNTKNVAYGKKLPELDNKVLDVTTLKLQRKLL